MCANADELPSLGRGEEETTELPGGGDARVLGLPGEFRLNFNLSASYRASNKALLVLRNPVQMTRLAKSERWI